MKVNDRHCSFYYDEDDEYGKVVIDRDRTVVLVIDMQNAFLQRPVVGESSTSAERLHAERWSPFYDETEQVTVPTCARILEMCRMKGLPACYARITSQRLDGSDRSLCEREPGFNDLLLPYDDPGSAIVDELAPIGDDLVFMKTTDSVVTGTNIARLLRNMDKDTVIVCGIYLDQCVASSVRTFADENFRVWLIEDAVMAATHELKEQELTIMNNIYCHVIDSMELEEALQTTAATLRKAE